MREAVGIALQRAVDGARSPLPAAASPMAWVRAGRELSLTSDRMERGPASVVGATSASMRAKIGLARPTCPSRSTVAMASGEELKKRAKRTSAARRLSPLSPVRARD
jgi:hypothetical protein